MGFIITTTQPLLYPNTIFYTLPKQARKRGEEKKKKGLPVLQMLFNQHTHLASKENKAENV